MIFKDITKIALDWAIRCFGHEHVHNIPDRALRLAEEAVELAQAAGIPKDKMLDLVNIVYSRPIGDVEQEIGGVMMTVTALVAANYNYDPDHFLYNELQRVLAKPIEHFTKRHQEKNELGLKL